MVTATKADPNVPMVTYPCPECGTLARFPLLVERQELTCAGCQGALPIAPVHFNGTGQIEQCVTCPSKELFLRKDFPQRVGVMVVSVGFLVSCYFWAQYQILWAFGVLFASALIDVVLYLWIGSVVECYRCHAQYRGIVANDTYAPFDMEAFEKHRQQAIRLQEARSAAK